MLETLHIRNLALVSELDVDFGPGLNIVTGETGAGKSLIIGAVQLLAGARATPGLIRRGEKSCEVAGVFQLTACHEALRHDLEGKLTAADIPAVEDERLILRRVITETGSRAYVNGALTTAGFLRELCEKLIDLHGPHDNQTLLSPAHQLVLLDTYANLTAAVAEVSAVWTELSAIRQEREALKAKGLTPEEADLLDFQLREITQADLQLDEEEALVQKYRLASHSRRLAELTANASQAICGDEGSVSDLLATQLRALRELQELDPERGGAIVEALEAAAENIQELGTQISDYAANVELDDQELAEIESRLDLIQRLKRKYGPTVADVLETAQRIRTRLAEIRGRSGRLQELADLEKNASARYRSLCAELTAGRQAAAPRLAAAIEEKLHGLGFLKAAFQVRLNAAPSPGLSGMDAVEFAFAPNVGEDMQNLRQAASSGEVARVMLAVKTVLSDADQIPVLVFDEIDANVGGRVALAVARELQAVARRHQVFSITHLPQIAAAGHQHFLVAKSVANERTTTTVQCLDPEERLQEIVRMLGAEHDSAAALAHARELLHLSS